MPKVTVLLPVYNAEKYVEEAIRSVLGQTFADFELLVIDDGSTDGSRAIIEGFRDSRIRYLRNEVNLQLIRTLNLGLREAKGEYIARMDSDDICFPQRLERQLQAFEREPDLCAVGSYAIRIDENGRHGSILSRPHGEEIRQFCWLPTPLIHPTVMLRRSILQKGFFYDEDCLHCEDYDLWIRLIKAGYRLENLRAPLIYYRVHSGGVSFQNRQLQLSNSYKVFRRHFPGVELSLTEYCALVGASGSLSWRRRLQVLNSFPAESGFSKWQLLRQLILHLRSRFMGAN